MVNGVYLLLSLGLATISALLLFQLAKCCGCWPRDGCFITRLNRRLLLFIKNVTRYFVKNETPHQQHEEDDVYSDGREQKVVSLFRQLFLLLLFSFNCQNLRSYR